MACQASSQLWCGLGCVPDRYCLADIIAKRGMGLVTYPLTYMAFRSDIACQASSPTVVWAWRQHGHWPRSSGARTLQITSSQCFGLVLDLDGIGMGCKPLAQGFKVIDEHSGLQTPGTGFLTSARQGLDRARPAHRRPHRNASSENSWHRGSKHCRAQRLLARG